MPFTLPGVQPDSRMPNTTGEIVAPIELTSQCRVIVTSQPRSRDLRGLILIVTSSGFFEGIVSLPLRKISDHMDKNIVP